MAKTKSNPEDIFFSSVVKKQPNDTNKTRSDTNVLAAEQQTQKRVTKTIKREISQDIEKTIQLNVPIPITLKIEMDNLVNERRLSKQNNRYFIKNFVVEAIEEKIEHERNCLS